MPLQQFNRDAYAAQYKLLHAGYEKYAYKRFKTALDAQIKPVITHIKAYGGVTPHLTDMLITKQPMEVAYKDVYTKVGTKHAAWVMQWINRMGRKSLLSFLSEKWKQLMETFFENNSSSRISDVTETTREQVRKVLAESENLPISQRADYIVEQLDSPDFNRNRALVIARTETTTAANYGASLGNADADYQTNKQWIAIEDNATRPSHIEADGQVVENWQDFEVGGELAQYPGDMRLSAKEICNCRCTLAYIPVLDSSGLPILK